MTKYFFVANTNLKIKNFIFFNFMSNQICHINRVIENFVSKAKRNNYENHQDKKVLLIFCHSLII